MKKLHGKLENTWKLIRENLEINENKSNNIKIYAIQLKKSDLKKLEKEN